MRGRGGGGGGGGGGGRWGGGAGGGGGGGGWGSAPNPGAASPQEFCWGLRPQTPAWAPPQTPLGLCPKPRSAGGLGAEPAATFLRRSPNRREPPPPPPPPPPLTKPFQAIIYNGLIKILHLCLVPPQRPLMKYKSVSVLYISSVIYSTVIK